MTDIEARLAELGVTLPTPPNPVANYVAAVTTGGLTYISGQVSSHADGGIRGTVGVDLDPAQGRDAARLCGVNLLAQMRVAARGDLARVRRVVKLGGFVQCGPDFSDIPAILNGCSDLLVHVLGDAGRHSRSAVGVYRLPLGFAVEVDAVVEIDGAAN
ncbi:RidA family protein [Phenylobacterium sp.]|uniref:RidA family protein n=1 Tax=Phenylobacterium sp. TaxID=1871053 RepID=UPI00301E5770